MVQLCNSYLRTQCNTFGFGCPSKAGGKSIQNWPHWQRCLYTSALGAYMANSSKASQGMMTYCHLWLSVRWSNYLRLMPHQNLILKPVTLVYKLVLRFIRKERISGLRWESNPQPSQLRCDCSTIELPSPWEQGGELAYNCSWCL